MSELVIPDFSSVFQTCAKEFAAHVVGELQKLLSVKLPALLSAKEVASILGVSERQVWRLASAGELPAPKELSSKLTKWRRLDIEAFVEN